jgi:hypothetical protein
MAKPVALGADKFDDTRDFLGSVESHELVYFLANVGDGDAQVVLLPEDPVTQWRRALVIDAGRQHKIPRLLEALRVNGLLPSDPNDNTKLADDAIAVVVATHPHHDHIAGLPELFRTNGSAISELWDSGYWHPGPDYHDTMTEIEALPHLVFMQPASGTRRWFGDVAVTVLSPSIQLRNRFDSYGVDINNASISLRLEFPAARVLQRGSERELLDTKRSTNVLILGADAQTLSWSYVVEDFPELKPQPTAANRALRAANGADELSAQTFKISHHCSKHGINLELIERIKPALTLISSVGGDGKYNFPHDVAQGLLREALAPNKGKGVPTKSDAELNIFYTSDHNDASPPEACGSIAVVIGKKQRQVWRFFDRPSDLIDFANAKSWR